MAGWAKVVAVFTTFCFLGVSPTVVSAPKSDPLEPINRVTFQVNQVADQLVIKPLARGYHAVTPDLVETGVNNFFSNIGDVVSLLNNGLQLKLDATLTDFARIAFNSTFGLAGLIDVATPMGLVSTEEDFGQTLGYWGVPSGPYLVLPLFGSSSFRDGIGRFADSNTDLWRQVDHIPTRNSGYGLRLLDNRVSLFPAEKLITGDAYSFVRDAYLQRREFAVKDGRMDLEFDQSDF